MSLVMLCFKLFLRQKLNMNLRSLLDFNRCNILQLVNLCWLDLRDFDHFRKVYVSFTHIRALIFDWNSLWTFFWWKLFRWFMLREGPVAPFENGGRFTFNFDHLVNQLQWTRFLWLILNIFIKFKMVTLKRRFLGIWAAWFVINWLNIDNRQLLAWYPLGVILFQVPFDRTKNTRECFAIQRQELGTIFGTYSNTQRPLFVVNERQLSEMATSL